VLNRFAAGDTFTLSTTLPDYPAGDGWVLHYRLVPRETPGTAIDITCTADGDAHVAAASASTTASWQPGEYSWASWVDRAGESFSVATGSLTLTPDPRVSVAGADARSAAETALANARAALELWNPLRKRYRIGDREMEFNSPADIIRVIRHWEGEVRRERAAAQIAAGIGTPRGRVFVRLARG
jgi:hypothetical protein